MIRIGTRGSALALAQAKAVGSELPRLDEHEIVVITTAGDRGEAGDKARWTSELERALLAGDIDLAVHSAKDVPGELADGTVIAWIPVREDPRDVICGVGSLAELAPGARVGTSSLRRASQLRALRDDLEIVELRGNVDTRLQKLAAGEADAIVLAAAGLKRLGRGREIGGYLDELLPAPGQGALIVQGRIDNPLTSLPARGPAEHFVAAERALASALGASCNTPLGALADLGGDRPHRGNSLRLRGWVGLPDGSHWIADELSGRFDEIGPEMAERMLAVGAGELLDAGKASDLGVSD